MQQFQVPLLIEEEAPIFGPLTLMQFAILGAAGGMTLLILIITQSLLLTFGVGILLGLPATYLAFAKINGEKVPKILIFAIKFSLRPSLALWQKRGEPGLTLKEIQRIIEEREKIVRREFKESRLKKLAWEVETGRR